jgi:hypothetical protein
MHALYQALEEAIEKVKQLSPERQEEAAHMLEQLADAGDGVYKLTDEERRLVREGLDELDRGALATEDQASAVYAKYRG